MRPVGPSPREAHHQGRHRQETRQDRHLHRDVDDQEGRVGPLRPGGDARHPRADPRMVERRVVQGLGPLDGAVPAVEGRVAEGAVVGQVDDVEACGVEPGKGAEDGAGPVQGARDRPGPLEMAGALVVDVPADAAGHAASLKDRARASRSATARSRAHSRAGGLRASRIRSARSTNAMSFGQAPTAARSSASSPSRAQAAARAWGSRWKARRRAARRRISACQWAASGSR